jgi:hypothetical protein
MSSDPFAQPSGNIATATIDPFGQPTGGGGGYPKPIDLLDTLLLITPIKVEVERNQYNPEGVKTLHADVVILDGPRVGEEYNDMWWNQTSVVKAAEAAMRAQVPSVLGRLRRFPMNEDKKAGKYATAEDIEKAFVTWKPGMANVRFAWALDKFTEDDARKARAYLAGKASPFGG